MKYLFIACLFLASCDSPTTEVKIDNVEEELDTLKANVKEELDTIKAKSGPFIDSAGEKLERAGEKIKKGAKKLDSTLKEKVEVKVN